MGWFSFLFAIISSLNFINVKTFWKYLGSVDKQCIKLRIFLRSQVHSYLGYSRNLVAIVAAWTGPFMRFLIPWLTAQFLPARHTKENICNVDGSVNMSILILPIFFFLEVTSDQKAKSLDFWIALSEELKGRENYFTVKKYCKKDLRMYVWVRTINTC